MTKDNLFKRAFRFQESDCTIIADMQDGVETAISSIKRNRALLEEYVRENPIFLHSFEPVTFKDVGLL
jgi:ApbE superfamily uncharacterized protein (UPF0280 family)